MNALDGISIAILLAVIGSLLVVAEVFFPSGGVLGFLSASAFIAAIYSAYTAGGVLTGLGFAAAEVVIAPAVVYLAFLLLPKTPLGKILIGSAPTEEEVRSTNSRHELVGQIGIARTMMLPAGSIEIDGQRFDAVSQGQAIEPGEPVKVIEASGNRIVVRRAPHDEQPKATDAMANDLLTRPAKELGLEEFDFDDKSET